MVYNGCSGLHLCFSEWRIFCREAWQKRYSYIQIYRDKDLDDMHNIKNLSVLDSVAFPETTTFEKIYILGSSLKFNFLILKKLFLFSCSYFQN